MALVNEGTTSEALPSSYIVRKVSSKELVAGGRFEVFLDSGFFDVYYIAINKTLQITVVKK